MQNDALPPADKHWLALIFSVGFRRKILPLLMTGYHTTGIIDSGEAPDLSNIELDGIILFKNGGAVVFKQDEDGGRALSAADYRLPEIALDEAAHLSLQRSASELTPFGEDDSLILDWATNLIAEARQILAKGKHAMEREKASLLRHVEGIKEKVIQIIGLLEDVAVRDRLCADLRTL